MYTITAKAASTTINRAIYIANPQLNASTTIIINSKNILFKILNAMR